MTRLDFFPDRLAMQDLANHVLAHIKAVGEAAETSAEVKVVADFTFKKLAKTIVSGAVTRCV